MATDIITEIDRLKAELDELRPLPPDAAGRLAQKLRIEWNYHSNAIEGNSLTLGETRMLILHGLTARGKPMRDHLDIEGHDDAVAAIEEAVRKGDALNQAFIRNLHRVLLKEPYETPAEAPDGHRTMRPISVGQYKKMPNNVRTQTGETHYFAPPEQVQSRMSDLIDWHRSKEAEGEHPIVVAATFHYRFVQIHPFDDGNGRMARLLMNLILMKHGYTIAIVQQERDGRDRYIAEIEQVQATGSLSGFIAYIAECCRYSLQLHLRAARGESIEDPDDIDREIAIFKRSMPAASDGDTLVQARQLAQEVLLPLYSYFRQKVEAFATYFVNREIIGNIVTMDLDGETHSVYFVRSTKLDKLPQTAASLRFEARAYLSNFQAGDRDLSMVVVRDEQGTWLFEIVGKIQDVKHVDDNLDELKNCVNDVIRTLMTILKKWSRQPGPPADDRSE